MRAFSSCANSESNCNFALKVDGSIPSMFSTISECRGSVYWPDTVGAAAAVVVVVVDDIVGFLVLVQGLPAMVLAFALVHLIFDVAPLAFVESVALKNVLTPFGDFVVGLVGGLLPPLSKWLQDVWEGWLPHV